MSSIVFLPAHANEERISRIESELQELKNRIANLERKQDQTPKPKSTTKNSGGWKQLSNWRALQRGMSYSDVQTLFGDPESIIGGVVTRWRYGNRGEVVFYNDKLDSWREPDFNR